MSSCFEILLIIKGIARSFRKIEKKKDKTLGYDNNALIDIPHADFIIEILHMFLRISDLLFDLLINELMGLDTFHKQSKFDCKKHIMLKLLQNFLSEKCNLDFIKPGATIDAIRSGFKTLTGTKRIDVFKKITSKSVNIHSIFGNTLEKSLEISILWCDYWRIDR